jgi:O-antigen/teichoic acid export membrane protein
MMELDVSAVPGRQPPMTTIPSNNRITPASGAVLVGFPVRFLQLLGTAVRRRLHASGFLRGASALFAGTVLAQATSLAVWPILTRLYRPAEFGVLGTYLGLITVLVTVASLRYENAIPIARHDRQALDLLAVCGLGLVATSVIVAVAAFTIPDEVLEQAGLLSLAPYRFFVPLGFAWVGAYSALFGFATREGAFVAIARTRVSQALAGPASQVFLGLAGAGTSGLLLGFIVAQCAGMLPLFRLARSRFRVAGHVVSLRGIASVMRQFRNFPLISTWGALVESIGGAVALYLLIGMFYPAAITGFLFLTERAVGRPLRMVASSLAPVAFSEAGRAVHTDPTQLRRRFLQLTLRSSVVAACWIVTVNIAAAWLFPMVFGPGWSDAVPFVRAVSVWYFFATVTRVTGPLLLVLERQVLNAITQIGGPLFGVAAFLFCGYRGLDAVVAVWAYSTCQAIAAASVIPATLMAIDAVKSVEHAGEPR